MARMNRRQFLAGVGAASVAGATAGMRAPHVFTRPSAPPQDVLLDCRWWHGTLDGHRVRLRTYAGERPPATTFPTGPMIKTRGGETLRVMVANHLTPYDSSAWSGDPNVPHHLNTTNLHLHGLDVIPHLFRSPNQGPGVDLELGTGDPAAPMIAIPPGSKGRYTFQIPRDQPPGFYWYHPHHHGSTVVQAVTGMAGGLIVYGDIDDVPEIAAARDIPLVIQDIGLFPSEEDPTLFTYEPRQNAIWDTFASQVRYGTWSNPEWTDLQGGFSTGDYKLHFYLVNGQPVFRETHNPLKQLMPNGTQLSVPRISIRPGEIVRLRILNGTSDNLMPLLFEGHDVHLLALDGVNFTAPRTIPWTLGAAQMDYGSDVAPQVQLAPANRAEMLIVGSATPGSYQIVALAQSQQFILSAQKTLAEIVVEGDPVEMALPTELPAPSRCYPLIQDHEITRVRDVVFAAQFHGSQNPVVGLDFAINGVLYREREVGDRPPWPELPPNDVNRSFFDQDDWTVRVGDVEEWHLNVPSSDHGGNEGHPFHIHVNSFEVYSIGGVLQPPGTIQDTVWVPENDEVVIRIRFIEWSGKSVFHCHILPHEDTGMMKNFLILPRDR